MFGWNGKLLRVNLSNGVMREELLAEEFLEKFLGGCSLATEIARAEGASGEESKVVFACGPLTGTGAPTAAFCNMAVWREGQEVCAPVLLHFGPELKYCGYDALVIEGEAPEWCYLLIVDGEVRIVPAGEIQGYTSSETEGFIRSFYRKWYGNEIRIVSIGPEGEADSSLGAIATDGLLLNQTGGLGNALGQKRLKAIGLRGTFDLKLAKPAGFQALITDMIAEFRAKREEIFNSIHQIFPRLDIPLFIEIHHGDIEKRACMACPIACLHQKNDKFLPNSTVCFCFGELLEISEIEKALDLYDFCVAEGIDPVALSITLRLLMEMKEIKALDVDIEIGDVQGIKELVRNKDSVLHKGSFRLAKEHGAEDILQGIVKKIEDMREIIWKGLGVSHEQRQVIERLGLCPYVLMIFSFDKIIDLFEMATGKKVSI